MVLVSTVKVTGCRAVSTPVFGEMGLLSPRGLGPFVCLVCFPDPVFASFLESGRVPVHLVKDWQPFTVSFVYLPLANLEGILA